MNLKKKTGNRVCIFKAHLGDCEDPDLYASGAIAEYLDTAEGKWVYEECGGDQELMWYTVGIDNEYNMGFVAYLYCNMTDKQKTYWKLLKNENTS